MTNDLYACAGCGDLAVSKQNGECDKCRELDKIMADLWRGRTTTRMEQREAATARLRELLAKYADHTVSCPQRHSYVYACTCGWAEARAEVLP